MTNDTAPTCTHCKCALIFDSRTPTCERWVCSCGYFVMRALDLRVAPPIPGIEQRCARCGVQIDDLATHQERCFVVGDAVRWEYPLRSLWVEGDYIDSADRGFWTEHRLTVRAASSGWDPDEGDDTEPPVIGTKHSFGTDNHSGTNLRRIPRLGQERHRPGCPSSVLNNDPRCIPPSVLGCACSRPLPGYPEAKYYPPKPGETLSKAEIDAKRTGQEVAMDHYCRGCGLECAWSAISDGVYCNPCRAKSGLPALPRKHGPGGSGLSGPCDADCRKCAVERAPLAEMPVRCGRCHNDPCTCPPPQTDKTWLPTTTGTSTSTTTIIRYVRATKASSSADPLDVWYDGVPLRTLLEDDKLRRLDNAAAMARCRCNTSAQRAAVSAHWSADLRAKVTASRSAERNQVVLEQDAEDFEW